MPAAQWPIAARKRSSKSAGSAALLTGIGAVHTLPRIVLHTTWFNRRDAKPCRPLAAGSPASRPKSPKWDFGVVIPASQSPEISTPKVEKTQKPVVASPLNCDAPRTASASDPGSPAGLPTHIFSSPHRHRKPHEQMSALIYGRDPWERCVPQFLCNVDL